MKRVLLLLLLVTLSVSPAFALAQTGRVTEIEAGGSTLNVDVPDGWSARTNAESVYMASSEAALTELWDTGFISDPEATGVVIYHPVFLQRVNLEADTSSERVLATYRTVMVADGDIEASDAFAVPGSFGQFMTSTGVELWGLALEFPSGTVLVSMIVGKTVPPELDGVLQSIALSGGEGSAPVPSSDTTTTQIKDGGLTLSITHPGTWVTDESSGTLMLATSQTALDALNSSGVVTTPGDVGVIIYMPSMLRNLSLDATADPVEVVTAYLESGDVEGNVETLDALQVPGAAAMIDMPTAESVKALVGALQFPAGTIIFGVVPGDTDNPAMGALLRSIALTDDSAAAADESVTIELGMTPTAFDVPQRAGDPIPLSVYLPDDWESSYSQNAGFVYLGSSEAVVDKISSANAGLQAGEIGVTLVLPAALPGIGVEETDTPEQAIQRFEERFRATGTIQNDDSFGVPAAYARVTGERIPSGGGVVYVIAYEAGTILAVIQPASAASESVVELLRTMEFGAVAVAAEPIRQWASSADGSSEYGEQRWGFEQATGEPNTKSCGDRDTAWAGQGSTSREYLRVFFDEPVIPSQINIYQTYNPGAIVGVGIGVSDTDQLLTLPDSADPVGNTECPGVFSYDVSDVTTPVDFVVIYLDQSLTGNWNEIDAVEMVGTPAG